MIPLARLAAHYGIAPDYRDAMGVTRHVTEATQRALLAAMGVSAGSDDDAERSLLDLDRRAWQDTLPPVLVVQAGAAPRVAVVLPAGLTGVSWSLTLEDGSPLAGWVDCADMDLLAISPYADLPAQRRMLALPDDLPLGYHLFTVDLACTAMTLIVAPSACWVAPAMEKGDRLWGVSTQLYLLRSATNWGIGDFSDLRDFSRMVAERGADVVGLNPLHAMFLDDPEQASPYSPASRLLLNVLYIDVEALPEFALSDGARAIFAGTEFQARLAACRAAGSVDYSGVASLKTQILRAIFEDWMAAPAPDRLAEFEAFRRAGGTLLERMCLFETLRDHFVAQDGARAPWHAWPAEYQDPNSVEVAAFARAHAAPVTWRVWLQFLADAQLGAATEAARDMAVGLYLDLAVGADGSGAETWADQALVVNGAQVGAPPDIFNPAGQNWGMPPFSPAALRRQAYGPFVDLIRANMRYAGGLRIDHVMGLQRLFWIPRGAAPAEGAYVGYDLEAMVGILALESQRHECLVVGEDLGTVPDGFRERMAAANILSYRVLFFETNDGGFVPPAAYPAKSVAVAGSHDLPTVRGWWAGLDIDLKEQLGLYPDPAGAGQARLQRTLDRAMLVRALRQEQLVADELDPELLFRAVHVFLARSRSFLAVAQIDDITDELEPVNIPSTSAEHPNWRRRLALTLEQIEHAPRLDSLARLMNSTRGIGDAA